MARTKAVLGQGARLADYLSASLLARVVPAPVVHEVLDAHGCNSQRLRSFPAVAGVYYCMALSLYPEAAYEEVFAVVAQGLAWAAGAAEPARVAKSSISGVRRRIGAAPLAELVGRCCAPLADPGGTPEAFFAGRRLVALDGSNFELADEPDNEAQFGRPGSRTGHAAFPQAQCAVLVECATHAILAANLGLTPQNDGQQVIINIPMLTEERRKQLVKQVHQECEAGKVSVRAIRKETNEGIKKIKGAPEDDLKGAEETVQKLTDDFISRIDALMKKKEGEIMTV